MFLDASKKEPLWLELGFWMQVCCGEKLRRISSIDLCITRMLASAR
jgi:hypothetical protein